MKKYITISLSLIIVGCSQVSSTHLRLPVFSLQMENIKKVAIFPFADYSYNFDRPLRWLFHRRVLEALTDEFIKQGIQVAIQEDVEGLLTTQGILTTVQKQNWDTEEIIKAIKTNLNNISVLSPEYEIKFRNYSEAIRQEIQKLVQEKKSVVFTEAINELEERLDLSKEPSPGGLACNLSEAEIIELGKMLDVDAIVRGRITAGKDDSSFLIRVYFQNAHSGQIFWSGGVKIEGWFFSLTREDSSFLDKAIRKGISSLTKELFKQGTKEELIAFSFPRPFKLSLREVRTK